MVDRTLKSNYYHYSLSLSLSNSVRFFLCFSVLHLPAVHDLLFCVSDSENSKNFDVKVKDKMGRDLVSAVMWDYEWVSSASSKAM